MTSETLLPCPFCGNYEILIRKVSTNGSGPEGNAYCTGCYGENYKEMWNSRAGYTKEQVAPLIEAMNKVIEMNRQHAKDEYGDAEKAEDWACVELLRKSLTEFKQQTGEK